MRRTSEVDQVRAGRIAHRRAEGIVGSVADGVCMSGSSGPRGASERVVEARRQGSCGTSARGYAASASRRQLCGVEVVEKKTPRPSFRVVVVQRCREAVAVSGAKPSDVKQTALGPACRPGDRSPAALPGKPGPPRAEPPLVAAQRLADFIVSATALALCTRSASKAESTYAGVGSNPPAAFTPV